MKSSELLAPAGRDADAAAAKVATNRRGATGWRRFWLAARIAQVRLRFLAVFVLAFVVVGKWDALRNYWDKLTEPAGKGSQAVSTDTGYFCPMDPGVLSDWPANCPVCNMDLVRRKRGQAGILPEGVVARMQFSPYRVQLAGIRTGPVAYLPLAYELNTSGILQADPSVAESKGESSPLFFEAEVFDRDLPLVRIGQSVAVTCPSLPNQEGFAAVVSKMRPGRVGIARSAWMRVNLLEPTGELQPGMFVTARLEYAIANLEPFRSQPFDAPPLAEGEQRTAFVCPDHADVVSTTAGKCPRDGLELEELPLLDNQRLRWWCSMHPEATADEPGHQCEKCDGMELAPRIVTYNPPGQVLAVPETAVVDHGARKIVYVERMKGMFDAVEVTLGRRSGDFYPVIRGLGPNDRVAMAGAFLIDAESRLNPGLAAHYFGARDTATNNPSARMPTKGQAADESTPPANGKEDPKIKAALAKLSVADQQLAARQVTCPVTDLPLGSMGKPIRVEIDGTAVLLCCSGCESKLRKQPQKYLDKLSLRPATVKQP